MIQPIINITLRAFAFFSCNCAARKEKSFGSSNDKKEDVGRG